MKPVHAWSIIFLGCFSIVFTNCNQSNRAGARDSLLLSTENLEVYYNLNEPEAKYFLPYYLAEISGLAFQPPNSLLAVQDEQGILYEFDLLSEKVIHSTKFDSRHDFEGIEVVGDSIFVLESDGDIRLITFPDTTSQEPTVREIETDLDIKNDTEGLGYDPNSHSILIACKASGRINRNGVDGKAVYRFDLSEMKLDPVPFFKITKRDLEKYFERKKGQDYEPQRFRFEPSAIAFNPADGFYYLMASVGKLIVVFDSQGVIRATYPVPSSLFVQPEGLCFSPNGDMYISSEGNGDKGYIIKYLMKKR